MASRRKFIQIGTGAAAALSLPACSTKTLIGEQSGRVIRVPLEEITRLASRKPGVWVQTAGRQFPVIVVRANDEWYALSARCTHEACAVKPVKGILACTCHNSRFNYEGEIRGGPAPRPLPTYAVAEVGEYLEITV